MELDVLRFFAKAYVAETESLTYEEKSIMFDFLDEADEYEILATLHTGDIPAPLTEQEMTYLEYSIGDEVNGLFEAVGMEAPFSHIYMVEPSELLEAHFVLTEDEKKGWKEGLKGMAGKVKGGVGRAASKVAATPGNIAHDVAFKARGMKKSAAYKWGGMTGKEKGMAVGKAAGATALAAAAIAAAYAAYKKFMSKASRACKGATNKSACMDKYRQQARAAQVQTLKSQQSACNKAKNPEKCRAKIGKKISRLQAKM